MREGTVNPDTIWKDAAEEGERRLDRGTAALASTGLVGGVDVMFGVLMLVSLTAAFAPVMPHEAAAAIGALGFGIGFVFVTVGRSELFTENFLIPIAAVAEGRRPLSAVGRLWAVTLVANIAGLALFAVIIATDGVLPDGAIAEGGALADAYAGRSTLAAFLSAILAGTAMTVWTWIDEAATKTSARIMVALLIGFLLAVPMLNHVVVSTGELLFGIFGGETSANMGDLAGNFGLALAGNFIGGYGFVTLTRVVQARGEDG